ncbi:hypothetical protein LA080_006442 [Diaporthe eres]|nr:hypothetical protein LA080_006442 [Diaporthe eres]
METRTTTMSGVGPTMTFYPVTTPEPWPPIFMYGARPLSLDGAQIERELPDELDQPRQRLRVSCPNGNSSSTSRTPEEEDADEQCLRADLFPADWYQTQGTTRTVSIFGGTYTPSEAPEKTWRCEMTEAMGEAWETLVGGDCSLWESPSGAADASTTTTGLGRCDISRQYVPVRLTAGDAEHGEVPGPNEPRWLRGRVGDGDIGYGWVCDELGFGCQRGDGFQGRESWSGGFSLCGPGMCECGGAFVVASVVSTDR